MYRPTHYSNIFTSPILTSCYWYLIAESKNTSTIKYNHIYTFVIKAELNVQLNRACRCSMCVSIVQRDNNYVCGRTAWQRAWVAAHAQ